MALVRPPLGIELVRRGIVTQDDITKALDYQKENPSEKLGDILYLQSCYAFHRKCKDKCI